MRAIVKSEAAPGLEIRDVEPPGTGSDEVAVRVRRAGICGTDLHIRDWDRWSRSRIDPPLVLGHEFMGEVVETGSLVGSVEVGDRVSAEGHIVCGHCRHCRTGDAHVCRDTSILGIDRDGAFAERVVVPATNIVPVPDAVDDDHAAVFDPLGNAFHTVLHTDVSGRSVVVVGCGPIGLFAVGIARAAGARPVVAVEPVPDRREIAGEMGADHLLDPAEVDVPEAVRELTDGYGADVVCEMSGHPEGIRSAFRACRNAGHVRLLGLPEDEVSVDLADDVIFRGLHVYGVIGRRMYGTWLRMRDFLAAGLLDVEPVITHRLPFDRFEDGFRAVEDGEAAKVVLQVA
jgi:threonine 3-dehydrogenase